MEAFRPEELQFTKEDEQSFISLKDLKKKKFKVNALATEHKEYENYRSSSWDSAKMAEDTDLIDPLIMKNEKTKA
jgi:hypothetical protein